MTGAGLDFAASLVPARLGGQVWGIMSDSIGMTLDYEFSDEASFVLLAHLYGLS